MKVLARKHLVWGIANDNVIFIEEHRALALAALGDASGAAKTWGEAMFYIPEDLQVEIRDRFDDGDLPKPGDRFEIAAIPGLGDGDWPFAIQEMLEFLPAEVIELGETGETIFNGPRLDIPAAKAEAALHILWQRGWITTRSDVLVARAIDV